MIEHDIWENLYGERWKKEIGDSISHPAKFSRALIRHIYEHAFEEGWIEVGSYILDPFGGVGLGALDAMKNGLNWVGVELELKHATNGIKNIEFWNEKYGKNLNGWGTAVLLQGDSRKLVNILRDVSGGSGVEASVASPPFVGTSSDGGWQMLGNYAEKGQLTIDQVKGDPNKSYPSWDKERDTSYGNSEGQMADMKEKPESYKSSLAVSSPPFLQTSGGTNVTSTEGPLSDPRLLKRHSAGNAATNAYGNDANNLGNMPSEKFEMAVASPPYSEIAQQGGTKGLREHGTGLTGDGICFGEYGETEGQLGRMKADNFDSAIASSPYIDTDVSYNSKKLATFIVDGKPLHRPVGDMQPEDSVYGKTEGQLSNMKDNGVVDSIISSPPYSEARIGTESGQEQCGHNNSYGVTDGQLGSMKAVEFSSSVSSPPFESVTSDRPSQSIVEGGLKMGRSSMGDGYGETEGQLGSSSGNDFWLAAREIIDQTYYMLKPGGHAIWVVKRFIKNKKPVYFPRMWAKVCVAAGFEVVHWHRASVVEYNGIQYDMFGAPVELKTERKSFFRRLHERRGGERIDYEEVICMVKPY